MFELIGLGILGASGLGGYVQARKFVREKLRFVDSAHKPAAKFVAGVAATLNCTNGTGGPATVAISVGLNGPQSLLTLDFAALPNVDCCTVTLTGDVEQAFEFHVLAGDVNGSGTVNATDKNLVKGNINKPVDATRFQMDVNATGAINATDKNLTKGWIGETAASCP